jgi:mycofactocin precursor
MAEHMPVPQPAGDQTEADLAADELLVEEVSIDGMCGVY